MAAHDLWHIAVLGSTLFGAAGGVILLLGPLVFDSTAPGMSRARPFVVALIGMAAILLGVEWLWIH